MDASKKRQEVDSSTGADVVGRIEALLQEVPTGLDGKLSFNDLGRYRQNKEQQFKDQLGTNLKQLGIAAPSSIQLLYDPVTGDVNAMGAGNDQSTVQTYFTANPDVTRQFGTLVQLGKLVDSAKARLGTANMDTRLHPSAMAVWFDTNTSTSALFSRGGMSVGGGQSSMTTSYRSLDIRV